MIVMYTAASYMRCWEFVRHGTCYNLHGGERVGKVC